MEGEVPASSTGCAGRGAEPRGSPRHAPWRPEEGGSPRLAGGADGLRPGALAAALAVRRRPAAAGPWSPAGPLPPTGRSGAVVRRRRSPPPAPAARPPRRRAPPGAGCARSARTRSVSSHAPHSPRPAAAAGRAVGSAHIARYSGAGSVPHCRSTHRAHARTRADRSVRYGSASACRPARCSAVTPADLTRGRREPRSGARISANPSKMPSPVPSPSVATAALAHRSCTTTSGWRAAVRASRAPGSSRRSTATRCARRAVARSPLLSSASACEAGPVRSTPVNRSWAKPPRDLRPTRRISSACAASWCGGASARSARAPARTGPAQSAQRMTTSANNAGRSPERPIAAARMWPSGWQRARASSASPGCRGQVTVGSGAFRSRLSSRPDGEALEWSNSGRAQASSRTPKSRPIQDSGSVTSSAWSRATPAASLLAASYDWLSPVGMEEA